MSNHLLFFVEKLKENDYFYLKSLNKMGCNCKKKINTKYVDNEEFGYTELKKISGFAKVGNAILQFLFGILISAIIIVGLIPACLYIIFSVCTGREMVARIPDTSKWFKKK